MLRVVTGAAGSAFWRSVDVVDPPGSSGCSPSAPPGRASDVHPGGARRPADLRRQGDPRTSAPSARAGQECPVFPPPAGLLNPGRCGGGARGGGALRGLEGQGGRGRDGRPPVAGQRPRRRKSWGREDAQAGLWGLIVEAIHTPAPIAPTTSRRRWTGWQLDSGQAQDAALPAGAEYATWAGLDLNQYWCIARTVVRGRADRVPRRGRAPVQPPYTPRGGYRNTHLRCLLGRLRRFALP